MPKVPAAEKIDVDENGVISGLWNVTQNVSFHLVGEMPSSPLIPTVSPIF
ncbi:MAG: formate--tetrahydrofolate ligase [Oscillospiraceae bacterium]|nr:formate--tetrahydrofolate ligase [Oscillospiraceae bacterium]